MSRDLYFYGFVLLFDLSPTFVVFFKRSNFV